MVGLIYGENHRPAASTLTNLSHNKITNFSKKKEKKKGKKKKSSDI